MGVQTTEAPYVLSQRRRKLQTCAACPYCKHWLPDSSRGARSCSRSYLGSVRIRHPMWERRLQIPQPGRQTPQPPLERSILCVAVETDLLPSTEGSAGQVVHVLGDRPEGLHLAPANLRSSSLRRGAGPCLSHPAQEPRSPYYTSKAHRPFKSRTSPLYNLLLTRRPLPPLPGGRQVFAELGAASRASGKEEL